MTGYAFKVRPLEGGFVSRDLTTSSRNHISGVRFWKDNFGRFTDTTDRETIYSLTCDGLMTKYGRKF